MKPGDVVFLVDCIMAVGAWDEIRPTTGARNRDIGGDGRRGIFAQVEQVFLLIDTNHLGVGVAPVGLLAHIQKILDDIHLMSSHTQIYVQSVNLRSIEFCKQIESLNQAIAPAIEGEEILVDLYSVFLASDVAIKDAYINNEFYFEGAGHMAWRDAIQDLGMSQ